MESRLKGIFKQGRKGDSVFLADAPWPGAVESPRNSRILIVDGDPSVVAATRGLLQGAGYELFEALTGEDGVRLAREVHPDLVLMDTDLPGMSGSDAVKTLKSDPELSEIFVVGFTNPLSPEERSGGRDIGADGYMSLPASTQRSISQVDSFLRQKKTGDALRASEELFSSSFEMAPIGMALVAPNGRCLKVNQALCELLGRSQAELLCLTFQEITHPQDWAVDRTNMKRLIAGEIRSYQVEKRYFHRDGHVIYTLLNVSFVRDAMGDPFHFIVHVQDISESKRTRDELLESLREVCQFKMALDEHAIVAVTDPQGKITYANDRFCAVCNYSRSELLGKDHRIVNSGYHSKSFFRELWKTIIKGQVWHGEIRNRAKDGSIYWVDTTIVPFLDPQGAPREYMAIHTDITARKQIEEELRSNTAFLKAQLDATAEGITAVDEQGRITLQNLRALEMFDIPKEVVETKLAIDQLNWFLNLVKDPKGFLERLAWVEKYPQEVIRDEIELKDGRILDRYSAPVSGQDGTRYGRIWTVRDITERKRTEQRAEEALKKEVVLRREIHHRVKNNLQIIISLLYLQSTKVRDTIALSLLKESQMRVRSIALVHEMLYQRDDLTSISFKDYVWHLTADLFLAYRISQSTIKLRISSDGIYLGLNSAIPFGIILTELITNALKYAFPSQRTGAIEVALLHASPSTLTLTVRDNGVGLPSDLDLKSSCTMGISLVTDLSRQLGGSVQFRADPEGCGTTVEITLPAASL